MFRYFHTIILSVVILFPYRSDAAPATKPTRPGKVRIYPAPKGEALNSVYKVSVSGRTVPVYNARIGAADDSRRFKAVDDLLHSDQYYDTAAFAYFDMAGAVTVTVSVSSKVNTVKILPSSAKIKFIKNKNSVSFKIPSPQDLTVEINGEWVRSLHIFANGFEKNAPNPADPNVIYFGPGIHEVTSMMVGDNKTVYVAGGAIVRGVIGKNEKFGIEPSGLRNYDPAFRLVGRNIKFRGHGIIDGSALPTHSRNFVFVKGSNILIEDVIIRNSSTWTVPLRGCNNVIINNIKILGYRANTDGIDICNSRNVVVQKCFIRTNDDLIVVKTWEGEGPSEHIVVKNCVLWNQLAHPLSIGSELRENVNDVLFTDCDIIHDQGREWSCRVFQADSSTVSNVRFENLRIEGSHKFASLWIGKDISSYSQKPGNIVGVTFKNIRIAGPHPDIEIIGRVGEQRVKNVSFINVVVNGKPLTRNNMREDPPVPGLIVLP